MKLLRYFDELHGRNGLVDERDFFNLAGVLCYYFEGILRDNASPTEGYLGEALARMEDHFGPLKLEQIRQVIVSEGRKVSGTGMDGILEKVRNGVMAIAMSIVEIWEGGGSAGNKPMADRREVFLVHGHDTVATLEVARFLERLRLSPVILHERPNEGRTIIEKFEIFSDSVYAIVLLTPDDVGYPTGRPQDARSRARQNVLFELGYFVGTLGRRRVCALYKGDVEIPSDLHGVLYVPLDASGGWKLSVAKEMKQAGLDVDLNRALD